MLWIRMRFKMRFSFGELSLFVCMLGAVFYQPGFGQLPDENFKFDAEDWALLEAMQNAVDQHVAEHEVKKAAAAEVKSLCWPYIGCFNKEDTAMKHVSTLAESPKSIGTAFKLYTKKIEEQEHPILLHYEKPEMFEHIDDTKPVAIITHGFGGVKENMIELVDAFVELNNYNVIFVTWENGALIPYYPNAAVNSEVVGRQIGVFMMHLMQHTNVIAKNIHIVGFSLGAHVAGFAGKFLMKNHGQPVGRITGLDPANPLFENFGPEVHLWKDDAEFVDVIHTSAGSLIFLGDAGMTKPVGHVDFYPNGGRLQPGCFYFTACSHKTSVLLYVASISKCDFTAYPCELGYEAFQKGECNDCGTDGCNRMGHYSTDGPGRGSLFLKTGKEPDFCKQ